MPKTNVDEDIFPIQQYLDRFQPKPSQAERQVAGRRGRRARKPAADEVDISTEAAQAWSPEASGGEPQEIDPMVSAIMDAMISTEGIANVQPGPGVIRYGEIPEQWRKALPRDRQYIGIDPARMDPARLESLIDAIATREKAVDVEWLKKQAAKQQANQVSPSSSRW